MTSRLAGLNEVATSPNELEQTFSHIKYNFLHVCGLCESIRSGWQCNEIVGHFG